MQESLETKLSIQKIRVKAHHGWYATERKIGGMYAISVSLYGRMTSTESYTSIADTVNYEEIYDQVIVSMKEEHKLIESCCKSIWDKLKILAPNAIWEVHIEKEDVPIKYVGSTSFNLKG